VPTRGLELVSAHASALIDTLRRAITAIHECLAPGTVAISFDHCMRSTLVKGFLRVQSGMNAAKDYGGAAFAGLAPDEIAAQGIAGMNSYPHYIAGSNASRV